MQLGTSASNVGSRDVPWPTVWRVAGLKSGMGFTSWETGSVRRSAFGDTYHLVRCGSLTSSFPRYIVVDTQ